MWNAPHGYMLRFKDNRVDTRIRKAKDSYAALFLFADHCKSVDHVSHYLICNPHPLADMIGQWRLTGQPVWVLITEKQYWTMPLGEFEGKVSINEKIMIKTTTPNWNIPGAEYSFTPEKWEELNK